MDNHPLPINGIPTFIQSPNAQLSYTTTQQFARNVWIMELEQEHTLDGEVAQSRFYQHFYARSYAPGQMMLTGRVPTQDHLDWLGEFVRNHQIAMLSSGSSNIGNPNTDAIPLMRLYIPSEGVDYKGYVNTFRTYTERFNLAPEFTLDFEVIEDNHSTAIVPNSVTQSVRTFLFNPLEIMEGEVQFQPSSPSNSVTSPSASFGK
jgi:hypothetical protein